MANETTVEGHCSVGEHAETWHMGDNFVRQPNHQDLDVSLSGDSGLAVAGTGSSGFQDKIV